MASQPQGQTSHDGAPVYRDFSHVTASDDAAIQPLLQIGMGQEDRADLLVSHQNFPVKLHFMLSEVEECGLTHIVSWCAHGRAFMVHRMKEFVEIVLKRWFRQTKVASFQRQLNIYGFRRITYGPDKNSYYSEYFLRGKVFLAQRIPRMQIKGHGPRRPSSFFSEPNFYEMTFVKAPSVAPNGKNDQKPSSHSTEAPEDGHRAPPVLGNSVYPLNKSTEPPTSLESLASMAPFIREGSQGLFPAGRSAVLGSYGLPYHHMQTFTDHHYQGSYNLAAALYERERLTVMLPTGSVSRGPPLNAPRPSLHALVFQSIDAQRAAAAAATRAVPFHHPRAIQHRDAYGDFGDLRRGLNFVDASSRVNLVAGTVHTTPVAPKPNP